MDAYTQELLKAIHTLRKDKKNITCSFGDPDNTMDVGRPPQKKRALTDSLKVAATYSPTICSTIGVAELNDPVRNGKGWDLSAITT